MRKSLQDLYTEILMPVEIRLRMDMATYFLSHQWKKSFSIVN